MKKYFFLHKTSGSEAIKAVAMFFVGAVIYLILLAVIYYKYPSLYNVAGLVPFGIGIVVIGILSIIFYVRLLGLLKIFPDKLIVRRNGKNELEIGKDNLESLTVKNVFLRGYIWRDRQDLSFAQTGLLGAHNRTLPIIFKLSDGREFTYLVDRFGLMSLNKELHDAGYRQIIFIDVDGKNISEQISYNKVSKN